MWFYCFSFSALGNHLALQSHCWPCLPMQDIWHHIHSLMPLYDAARVACLSRVFLRSWRCYPNLTFNDHVFRPVAHIYGGGPGDLIDCIMRNHSGTGVKILNLRSFYTSFDNLNNWLRVAVIGFRNSPLGYLMDSGKSTSFPTRFYRMALGTQFGTLNLTFVPLAPLLNSAPCKA
jgi:hypothetical protein